MFNDVNSDYSTVANKRVVRVEREEEEEEDADVAAPKKSRSVLHDPEGVDELLSRFPSVSCLIDAAKDDNVLLDWRCRIVAACKDQDLGLLQPVTETCLLHVANNIIAEREIEAEAGLPESVAETLLLPIARTIEASAMS